MKKSNLASLAALALIASPLAAEDMSTTTTTTSSTCVAPTAAELSAAMAQLNPVHQAMVKAMNCEGQTLALKMINQDCAGKNTCKGTNSCKSDKNDCAGQGSCKGTSKGPFEDKNQAVDLAAKKMAEKRMDAMGK